MSRPVAIFPGALGSSGIFGRSATARSVRWSAKKCWAHWAQHSIIPRSYCCRCSCCTSSTTRKPGLKTAGRLDDMDLGELEGKTWGWSGIVEIRSSWFQWGFQIISSTDLTNVLKNVWPGVSPGAAAELSVSSFMIFEPC